MNPNPKTRIELSDNIQSALIKMAEGNPGGLTVCIELFKSGAVIDPDSALGGLGALLDLDGFGIYGSRIWMLYKDVCGQDIVKTHAVLRAIQLGLVSDDKVQFAIDHHGQGIDPAGLLEQVKKELPQFARKEYVAAI